MTVYLVGAGPGDPGLLTRRGADLLARADVVVYDRLVDPALLALAPPGAMLVDAGRAGGGSPAGTGRQEEIAALLALHGGQGRTVVRLKGGDPFLFGRGGEEAEALGREMAEHLLVGCGGRSVEGWEAGRPPGRPPL